MHKGITCAASCMNFSRRQKWVVSCTLLMSLHEQDPCSQQTGDLPTTERVWTWRWGEKCLPLPWFEPPHPALSQTFYLIKLQVYECTSDAFTEEPSGCRNIQISALAMNQTSLIQPLARHFTWSSYRYMSVPLMLLLRNKVGVKIYKYLQNWNKITRVS
jgi:hypothetical protein